MALAHSVDIVLPSNRRPPSGGDKPRTSRVAATHDRANGIADSGLASHSGSDVFRFGLQALDWLKVAFAICDSTHRLLQANHTAHSIFRLGDGIRIDDSGRLKIWKPSGPILGKIIRELIEAKQAARTSTTSAVIVVPRPSGKRPLIVSVLEPSSLTDSSGSPIAVVPITFWEHEERCGAEQILRYAAWGLTPTERRFANLLMEGLNLVDCCGRMRIRRTTGAFHLKNLFRKTGTSRQIELLSVLFRGVGSRSIVPQTFLTDLVDYSSRLERSVCEAQPQTERF
jgi:DNA-binding CsgD family transcriptional regulator